MLVLVSGVRVRVGIQVRVGVSVKVGRRGGA